MASNHLSKIPTEVAHIICSHWTSLEVMFVGGNVSRMWRSEIALPILKDRLKSYYFGPIDEEINDYNHFKTTKIGRTFIMMELRQYLYEYSMKLYDFQSIDQNSKPPTASIHSNNQLLEEYKIIEFYFSHFSIPNVGPLPSSGEKKGEKIGIFKMIGSLFSKPKQEKKQEKIDDKPIIVDIDKNRIVKPEKEKDIIMKIALDGDKCTGKSCFLNSSIRDQPIVDKNSYFSSIGMDFGVRKLSFPEIMSDSYKIQVWDSSSFRLTSSYITIATMIMEFFDLTSRKTFEHATVGNIPHIFRSRTTPLELILIGIRQDVIQEKPETREVPLDEIREYTFNHLGGALYVEMDVSQLKPVQSLIWYCALIQHLCHPKKQ